MLPQVSVPSRRAALRSASAAPLRSQRSLSCLATSTPRLQQQQQQQQRAAVASPLRFSSLPRQSPIAPSAARCFHASQIFAAETVKVPQMAESISEGTLKQWNKKKGDFVQADEEVAVIETDKIDVTVNAPQAGTITETLANEEDTVTVGQDLFKLEPGEAPEGGSSGGGDKGGEEKEQKQKQEEEDSKKQEEEKNKKQEESKKKEAEESKKQDQQKQQQQQQQQQQKQSEKKESKPSSSSSSSGADSAPSKPPAGSRGEQRVKMNRMRVRIAERLKQSQNTAASLTTFNEIDMTNLMQFRARHKDRILKEHGVKLGFMGAFTKAACLALKEIPAANASIEGEGLGDTIVYRDYVDVSVAVSTEKGLVTPVVRNAESMSIIEIEQEIARLGKKARDNKLTLEDMTGGTFTISNGGVFGSLFGTPILNLPGSAILGMHAIKEKPWVVEHPDGSKTIEIRPIMVIAITYDHRLLDGREAVQVGVKLKTYLEDLGAQLL
ncbi:dihydrolipoamide succinyltransferase [Jaminaea rosea]|uniref:dihydrolipoyllysine-residue succinyltransferase n=1 Tax=Jaminaea rosea TaxID=1569628 RepID=A0A316UZ02_9BASI|nr:dihydrolipoamide succinyltransferase [Jaminaea rosea]PWN30224.1 dihydrolipoamide succinyltransferase [Jaminaea rosea]